MRIKRKRFVFNGMRLFYFKEKLTTPLSNGDKTMKETHVLVKKIYLGYFCLKRKKMGKTYTQGRRKLFYGAELSKNVGRHDWPTTEN